MDAASTKNFLSGGGMDYTDGLDSLKDEEQSQISQDKLERH